MHISVILEINVTAPRRPTLVPGDHVFNDSSRHEDFFFKPPIGLIVT